MFIDIHVHTSARPAPLAEGKMVFATPDYLLTRYNMLAIEKAVILPTVNPEGGQYVQSNEEAVAICENHPHRFIPFCNVDPRLSNNSPDMDLDFIIRYYKSLGCKGCGEVCANIPFNDPRVENLFRACQHNGIPLTFHISHQIGDCYGLYDDPGLPLLEQALKKFPDLIFLGHSQPFWAEIGVLDKPEDRRGYPTGPVAEGRLVQLMRRYPNLHGDLSAGSGHNAVSRDEDFGPRFLEEFQDRLYFGTDICHPDSPTPLVDYLLKLRNEKKLSENAFHKIARLNAIRLLELDAPAPA